ncbi:MAG: tripartite tricarboxylate transporter permease, partial [PVC group bacterium]|nr:tripartite tricarboxylate transporter permease [PVC group bacterium]
FIADKQAQIQCQKYPYEMVDVLVLIDDVIGKEQFFEEEKRRREWDFDVRIDGDRERGLPERKKSEVRNNQIRSAWANGSFYLVTFLSVGVFISILLDKFHWTILPAVLIPGILITLVIGAFQLRNDNKLSQKKFMVLIKDVFKQLPLIRKITQE